MIVVVGLVGVAVVLGGGGACCLLFFVVVVDGVGIVDVADFAAVVLCSV